MVSRNGRSLNVARLGFYTGFMMWPLQLLPRAEVPRGGRALAMGACALSLLFSCTKSPAEQAIHPPLGATAEASWQGLALPSGLAEQEKSLDLVVVSIDTLRADRLPFYGAERQTAGSPEEAYNLAWLAQQGTVWETVWAPTGKTLPSLASFWTGLTPFEHGALDNHTATTKKTVAARLQEQGWATHAAVANRSLQPNAGLAKGFDSYQIRFKQEEVLLGASLLEQTAADVAAGKRLLVWAHFMAPHQTYEPATKHRNAFVSAEELASLPPELQPVGLNPMLKALHRQPALATPDVVDAVRALYDAEILTANDYLQEFLAGLDAQYRAAGRGGLLENALVVFFSDHGEELADHEGYFMHAKSLFSGVIQVPLVVVGGGWEAGARISAPLAMEDILALVLDGERPQRTLFPSSWKSRYYAMRDGPWTLIHNPAKDPQGPLEPPQDAAFLYPQVALYHRDQDPTEQRNLASKEVARTRAMLQALREWYLSVEPVEGAALEIDPITMSQLGYVDTVQQEQGGILPLRGEDWKP